MIATALYERTMAGYTASVDRGEGIPLSKYCRTHHVNYRCMRYWMKQYSIPHPGLLPSVRAASTPCPKDSDQPVISSSGLIPFVIQPAAATEKPVATQSSLEDVHLTTVAGIVVHIKEISPADLARLILCCNIR